MCNLKGFINVTLLTLTTKSSISAVSFTVSELLLLWIVPSFSLLVLSFALTVRFPLFPIKVYDISRDLSDNLRKFMMSLQHHELNLNFDKILWEFKGIFNSLLSSWTWLIDFSKIGYGSIEFWVFFLTLLRYPLCLIEVAKMLLRSKKHLESPLENHLINTFNESDFTLCSFTLKPFLLSQTWLWISHSVVKWDYAC